MRAVKVVLYAWAGLAVAVGSACSGDGSDLCSGFEAPSRLDISACDPLDLDSPQNLARCLRGSGHAGLWTVDPDGLPAYQFMAEQRCDEAAQHWSPRGGLMADPVHLVGNGRGVVAIAHASGGVELYSQDRGHKLLNKIDTWTDPDNPDYPPQIGGGFNYLVVDGVVRSTRFEDHPVGEATRIQTRRFGVGYVETVTTWKDIRVTRRVYAPNAGARAVVAEIKLENLTDTYKQVGLVEFWDVNLHQLTSASIASDVEREGTTAQLDRARRDVMNGFSHTVSYSKELRVATVETVAGQLPEGIVDRRSLSEVDYFPDPVYLGVIDEGSLPDAVWLVDTELWDDDTNRKPPKAVAKDGDSGTRSLELPGQGQRAILAARVQVTVPTEAPVVRRFAFGYVRGGGTPERALAELRGQDGEVGRATARDWRDRLVWAAVDGQDAAIVQRELAWASYNLLAGAVFDEYYEKRVVGTGGAHRYLHGVEGAVGEMALISEALAYVDPALAKETLQYILSTQRSGMDGTPFRFPYATTGVGWQTDFGPNNQRSDAYFTVPSAVGRYVGLTRDLEFFTAKAPYWPVDESDVESVTAHLRNTLEYIDLQLGVGARGLAAIGTGDYFDDILELSAEETSPTGTSSTLNAGFAVRGFPLVAQLLEATDSDLAAQFQAWADDQAASLDNAWSDDHFVRGFADSGNPLAVDRLFLEPQVLPILGGVVDDERRDQLLDFIQANFETGVGAVSTLDASIDVRDGTVWQAGNSLLAEAYALRDPQDGWDSFVRNTLGARAEAFPDTWYGIWTGPDSYNGPDHERPGEAPAGAVTAHTDFPALSSHRYAGTLRALVALAGITPRANGLFIDPKLPGDFSILWPAFELHWRADAVGGSITAAGTGDMVVEVRQTTSMMNRPIKVTGRNDVAIEFSRTADTVIFALPIRAGERSPWRIKSI